MKTLFGIAAASALALLLAPLAPAAVISRDWKTPGDGLLTYDDVNQRKWLDLTESRLSMFQGANLEQRFQNSLSQLQPGGAFDGFHIAVRSDLFALAESAGINTANRSDFSGNEGPTRSLIALVGVSLSFQNERIVDSFGLLDELANVGTVNLRVTGVLAVDPESGANGEAGLIAGPGAGSDLLMPNNAGIWLYRTVVPEPNNTLVAAVGLAALCGLSGRRVRSFTAEAKKRCQDVRNLY
jgi:hypothetical protein